MPYLDRLNRVCGFLDIEEKENSCRFQRRYFILDTQGNALLWYMDNPQNLPSGASFVGSLKLTYISKVPKSGPAPLRSDVAAVISDGQAGKRQQAYKTEIIGGVVVHTLIQNENEEMEGRERKGHRPGVLRCGYCVKQGNVRKSWKRRFFTLDDNAVSYYKSEDKEPLRAIPLRDIQRVHECLVKSGDLLLRDNLFEIITNSRTFYIQTDSPDDMHGWIRDIGQKIQEFRGPPKKFSFKRSSSLYRSQNSSSSTSRGHHSDECRHVLVKSCSVAAGWQPWTPVPPCESSIMDAEDEDSAFSSLPNLPSLSSSSTSSSTSSSSNSLSTPTPCPSLNPLPSTSGLGILTASGDVASGRRRHRSHPQPHPICSFPYSLDDDGIRTTDV
uniref:Pleckstrin homology domain containing A2 n=1 Tax=Cynoglossus semilaevis TaxID=244447 RepID=A0A3P8VYQ8_CYNSE